MLEDDDGHFHGAEAVIDKDLSAALLARDLGADALVILTDVANVEIGFGTDAATADRPYHSRRPAGPEVPCRIDGPQGRSGLPFRGGDRQAGDDRSA